jgi:hypothetical protein
VSRERGADARAAPGLADVCLFSGQPRKAHAVWRRDEWHRLAFHLHNDNGERRFVLGFTDAKGAHYVRSKRKTVRQAVPWAWNSITGRAKSPVALVPYSTNERGESRWGALDFDAHDADATRAHTLAFAAFRLLLAHSSLFLILESSGNRGGWHVWAIAREFHPVEEWARLLSGVCATIDAPMRPGICEIYPPDTARSEYGRGLRAPGCWNPKGGFSEIIYENCAELLRTPGDDLAAHPPIGELGGYDLSGNSTETEGIEFPEKRKKFSFSPGFSAHDFRGSSNGEAAREPMDAPLYREWRRTWSMAFAVTKQGTRNAQLCSLTGAMFHQVGREMALRIAAEQFRTKQVETKASFREHVENFAECWGGLEKDWLSRLTNAERRARESLATEHERDAFRIVHSYARHARESDARDFPIARDNLGERVGITGRGAGKIREKLAAFGIVRLAHPYRPNRAAARYVWTANESERETGKQP